MRMIRIVILFILISSVAVNAETSKIYLYPQSTKNSYLTIGKTFSVDVKTNVYGLQGYQFKLSWNSNIIELVNATPYPEKLWSSYGQLKNDIKTGEYILSYYATKPSISFTGSATLVKLNFKVKATGYTAISFSNIILGDVNAEDITCTKTDGSFDNRASCSRCVMLAVGPYIWNVDIIPVLFVISVALIIIEIIVATTIFNMLKNKKRKR